MNTLFSRHRYVMEGQGTEGAPAGGGNEPGAGAEGTPSSSGAPAPPTQQQQSLPGTDPNADALAKLQEDNRALQQQLASMQKEQEKAQEAQLAKQGEFEKLAQKKSEALEATTERLHGALRRSALQSAALKAGLRNLEDVVHVPSSDVTINEDDTVTGAEEAIAKLKERRPDLFGQPAASVKTPSVTPGGGRNAIDPNRSYSADELAAMTDEEFAKYRQMRGASSSHGFTDPFSIKPN